jgi:hypothetical protein
MKRASSASNRFGFINGLFSENLSYKFVALFISLILWFTILGRRDFVVFKNIELEVMVGQGMVLETQAVDRVRVKVSGPRTALKRFVDNGFSQQVALDASIFPEGEYQLDIPAKKIDVPFGVKVLEVKPASVKVVIKKSQ